MRLVLVHARTSTLELLRYPGFSVPTLAFPAIFFALFGLPRAAGRTDVLVVSFAAYAALSVAFFQFGVGIAVDRARPWELFVRSLPVGVRTRLAARALSALVFAVASVAVLLALAVPTTHPHLDATACWRTAVGLAGGALPFTLLGVALGYWLSPKAALPVANILYLGLAYVGGLWTGPTGLPSTVSTIGRAAPTRQWGELLWAGVSGRPWHTGNWLALLGYGCAFAALAAWGYRRDEGIRFR